MRGVELSSLNGLQHHCSLWQVEAVGFALYLFVPTRGDGGQVASPLLPPKLAVPESVDTAKATFNGTV